MSTNVVVFINDLMDTKGGFIPTVLSYGQSIDYLHYNQLLSALPTNWKQNIKIKHTLLVCVPQSKCIRWLSSIKINKSVYNFNLYNSHFILTDSVLFGKMNLIILFYGKTFQEYLQHNHSLLFKGFSSYNIL